jgi:hypothetical protein
MGEGAGGQKSLPSAEAAETLVVVVASLHYPVERGCG